MVYPEQSGIREAAVAELLAKVSVSVKQVEPVRFLQRYSTSGAIMKIKVCPTGQPAEREVLKVNKDT